MKTYSKKGRIVLTTAKVEKSTLDGEAIVRMMNKLYLAKDLQITGQVVNVLPIVVDNKRPMVGDKCRYNGDLVIVLDINDTMAKVSPVSPVIGEFNEESAKSSAFNVPIEHIYHRTLVYTDELNPKFIYLVANEKVKVGYIVEVIYEDTPPNDRAVPTQKTRDKLHKPYGYAIIKPFNKGRK